MVVDKNSLVKSKMERKGGLYVLPMWIKKKIAGDKADQDMPDQGSWQKVRNKRDKKARLNMVEGYNKCQCSDPDCFAPF